MFSPNILPRNGSLGMKTSLSRRSVDISPSDPLAQEDEEDQKRRVVNLRKEFIVEICEGCDLPGSIDWCGHWLCVSCMAIEQEANGPALAKSQAQELAIEESLEWSDSKRGSTLGWSLEGVMKNMDRLKALSYKDWYRKNG